MNNLRARLRFPWAAVWLLALLTLGMLPPAQAGKPLDIDTELRLLRDGQVSIHIGGARYRFAVFSFEDPDATGLGDTLASILSHDLLMNGRVNSLGVLRYLGGLGQASDAQQLRYFDKVEPLIESQGVQVAVWGMIRRTGQGIQIDSHVQLSPSVMQTAFSYTYRLPREMNGAPLVHRMGPDRMLTQRLDLGAQEAASLARVAASLDELRAAPADDAPVSGHLPLGKVHYLLERRGDWVRVGVEGGGGGWLRARGFYTGPCAPLLEVSQFATALMDYDEDNRIPERTATLADDAKALIDQMLAVRVLNQAAPDLAEGEALNILNPWCLAQTAAGAPPTLAPPGGAALCNLRVLAQLVGPTRHAAAKREGVGLTRERVSELTQQLARVSLTDPRHGPTLHNLATLFELLGDSKRAELAARLADAEPRSARAR